MDGSQNNIYKLNIISHIKTLWFSFTVAIVLIYFVIKDFFHKEMQHFIQAFLVILPFILPSVILYLNYFFVSFGKRVEIDPDKRQIQAFRWKDVKAYSFEELTSITKVCSYPEGENRIKWMGTDTFFYYIIRFKNNDFAIITSLMGHSLLIPGISIEIKKRFIPWITKNSYLK